MSVPGLTPYVFVLVDLLLWLLPKLVYLESERETGRQLICCVGWCSGCGQERHSLQTRELVLLVCKHLENQSVLALP
jgi:hypothetical protein